ncbi:MAG: HAMP domain-containing sensor histidine kinase, partial [Gemmatimonadota bacterium]
AGLTTSVTVNPDLAETLVIGGLPRSRLPLALVLLILTAGLVAGALFQLRREAELSRLRADFVSGVSHELRTPLAQIRMFAETLLLGRVRSQEEHTRSLEIIANESRRLTHQVENILLYSRGERRELRADVVPTAVSSVVQEVAEAFEPLATKAQCRLDVHVEDGLVAAADGGLLRQALLNLLDNAVKYGASGGTIRLAARRDVSGRAVITVEDRGPGVPLRDRSRIFEPYFRMADHRESAVAGSGIGLSVVRQVAGALGGTVEVGDTEGGGACFALNLRTVSTPSGAAVAPVPRKLLSGAGD